MVVQQRVKDSTTDVGRSSQHLTKQLASTLRKSFNSGDALLIEDAVRQVLPGTETSYQFLCDLQYIGHWGVSRIDLGLVAEQRNITTDESQRVFNFCLRNKILFDKSGTYFTKEGMSNHIYDFSPDLRSVVKDALVKGVIPNLDNANFRDSGIKSEVSSLEKDYLLYQYEYTPPHERGSLPTTYFVPNSLGFYRTTLDMADKVPIENRLRGAQDYVASLHQRQALQTILGLPIFYEPSRLAIPTMIRGDLVQIMDRCNTLGLSTKAQVRVPVLGETIAASVPKHAGIFTANLLGLTPSTLIGHEDYTQMIVEKSPSELAPKFRFGKWTKNFERYYSDYWLRYLLERDFGWVDSKTQEDLINNLDSVVAVCSGSKSASNLARETTIPVSVISQVKRKAISNGLAGRIHFRSHSQYFFE